MSYDKFCADLPLFIFKPAVPTRTRREFNYSLNARIRVHVYAYVRDHDQFATRHPCDLS